MPRTAEFIVVQVLNLRNVTLTDKKKKKEIICKLKYSHSFKLVEEFENLGVIKMRLRQTRKTDKSVRAQR